MSDKCIVGVQLHGVAVKAFDVCIRKTNVYVNYSLPGMGQAHCSYHASGQQHTKKEWRCMPNFAAQPGAQHRRAPYLPISNN
jgi:hypothetical protein